MRSIIAAPMAERESANTPKDAADSFPGFWSEGRVVYNQPLWMFSTTIRAALRLRGPAGTASAGRTGWIRTHHRPPCQRHSFTAIGVLHESAKRIPRSSNSPGTFAAMVFRCRRFMRKISDQGAYLEEDLGDTTLFEFLSRASRGRGDCARSGGGCTARRWRCCRASRWRPGGI